jgi:hypothetical protein
VFSRMKAALAVPALRNPVGAVVHSAAAASLLSHIRQELRETD